MTDEKPKKPARKVPSWVIRKGKNRPDVKALKMLQRARDKGVFHG